MSKRLITAAALVGLVTLAGALARAQTPDQRTRLTLRNLLGVVVESSDRGGQEEGVMVSEILANSPAERAGLREGDVITRVGRRTIEDVRDLANAVSRLRQGERLSIRVEREGDYRNLPVVARMARGEEEERDGTFRYGRANNNGNGNGNGDDATLPRLQQRLRRLETRLQDMERQGQYGRVASGTTTLGVQVREWRRQPDSRQGGSAEGGVEVMAVEPDSPAAEAGLRRGDIITRVDERNVTTRQELRQALQRMGAGQEMTLELQRGSRQMVRNVRLDGGSRYGTRDRRYERLQERIEQLEERLRELEQNP